MLQCVYCIDGARAWARVWRVHRPKLLSVRVHTDIQAPDRTNGARTNSDDYCAAEG